MKPMDRRSFLLGMFSFLKDGKDEEENVPAGAAPCAVLKIGRVADYPLGAVHPLPSRPVVIESLPEGLRARSTKDPHRCYALGMEAGGAIMLSLEEPWPPNRVLSILTCEPANL